MKYKIIFISFVLVSCVSQVKNLKKNQEFTHSAIISGKIIDGGIVSKNVVIKRQEQVSISELLRNQFPEMEKDYSIQTINFLLSKVDKTHYQNTVDDYQSDSHISEKNLLNLKKNIDEQYIFFSCIEQDKIIKDKYETAGEQPRIIMMTIRKLKVSFLIYDLNKTSQVFSGSVEKSLANKLEYSKASEIVNLAVSTTNSGIESAGGEKMIKERKNAYPEAPKTEAILQQVFRAIIDKMP